MSRHSKKHLKYISESELSEVEKLISEIEGRVPLEIRVVLETSRGLYPVGGARVAALVFLVLSLVFYLMWLPHLPFLFSALAAVVIALPSRWLARVPFAHLLVYRSERLSSLLFRAQDYFRTSDLSATSRRNAVLLFFSTEERHFYILPDTGLKSLWPNGEWQSYASDLGQTLATKQDDAFKKGIVTVLEKIRKTALERLGPASESDSANQLCNAVVVL